MDANIVCHVDGQAISFRVDMAVSAAATLATNVLGRKEGGMVLARESGDLLPTTAAIGEVCEAGERLTLVFESGAAAPCPGCRESVRFDQAGPSPNVPGTAHERKNCPYCDAPLIRQTDPIPAAFWKLDGSGGAA